MKAIVFNEELLKRLTGSDKVKVLTEKRHNELLEKIDKLEKKLEIAVKCLKEYAGPENWEDCTDENGVLYFKGLLCNEGHLNAVFALKQIEELDK